jgi:hypothetical protein
MTKEGVILSPQAKNLSAMERTHSLNQEASDSACHSLAAMIAKSQ